MLSVATRLAGAGAPEAPANLSPSALTRHAVCVGMTGSGKTGLCVGLLESLALEGVPILAIDPKGDLANLALVFPDLAPADFAPWLDAPPAAPGGPAPSIDELAARTAAAWRDGLAAAGLGPADLQAFRDRVHVEVITPGSDAGIPVDVLTSLTRAPAGLAADAEGLREYVTGAVGALLGLVNRRGDPLTDPAAILLARLLGDAFAAGRDLPFDVLLPAIVDPPFDRLGYFPLDEFLPRKERHALALAFDAVLASPAFAAWRRGVPLDVGAWLAPVDGRTPIRVLYLAHLDDAQRMFFVTLLLHAVVAWSRRQPGTSALRALVYFDEVAGYLPPHPKDPPSKWPVLTLMKQARAVGVGVALATQNPVDVDYKALSNAGTWFVGRLQTRQDRDRVVEGLVAAAGGLDRERLDDLVGALPGRTFVVREAGRDASVWRSRHTMSFLRGPLTRREVALLGQPGAGLPAAPVERWLRAPPPPPGGIEARHLAAASVPALLGHTPTPREDGRVVHAPAVYARFHLTFDERDWSERRVAHRLVFPLDRRPAEARPIPLPEEALVGPPDGDRAYEPLPGWLDEESELRAWLQRTLAAVHRDETAQRWRHAASGMSAVDGEDRDAFAARVADVLGRPDPGGVTAGRVALDREDVEIERLVLVWVPV